MTSAPAREHTKKEIKLMNKETTEIGTIVYRTSGYDYTEVEFFKKLSATKYQRYTTVVQNDEVSENYGKCVPGHLRDIIITSRKKDFYTWDGTPQFWSSSLNW